MTAADLILNALAQMEQRLREELRSSFREFQVELKLDLDGRFDAIHHRLDRLEQEYEMLKAGMARIEADVATLKDEMASQRMAVARLEKEMALVGEAIERLEARMERDHSDREDLREQALEFRRRLGDLEGRVKELEERLPPE